MVLEPKFQSYFSFPHCYLSWDSSQISGKGKRRVISEIMHFMDIYLCPDKFENLDQNT